MQDFVHQQFDRDFCHKRCFWGLECRVFHLREFFKLWDFGSGVVSLRFGALMIGV